MLDKNLATQLKAHLEKVVHPIRLVPSVDGGPKSTELMELLQEVAGMSERIDLVEPVPAPDGRTPAFDIQRVGTDVSVRFAGIPMGHEFTSLVLALLHVGGHTPAATDETVEAIRGLEGEYHFETFFSLSCQNCPDVVQALNVMSVLNPNIKHTAIDGALFQDEAERRQVMAVPTVFLDGEEFSSGRMSLDEIVAKLDVGAEAKAAERLNDKDPFDTLVVGGGPAGAAAAIYSARKAINTGVVAERFGGQVLDTMSIENFISVPYTEGPKFAVALEQHVREYDVDIMNLQRAKRLIPAEQNGDLIGVELENGAVLQSRTVVVATGARWRHMNVPGEDEYRNKGVAYCPHCDGPLFKGKRVAVIGGGNSGVEAAIDLAGIATQVTLIEFDSVLRADEVLQAKLYSLPNVTVITDGLSTEVHGDGSKVTSLSYEDRTTGESHEIDLEGIFVQIGLLPNTEWLKGTVELSPRGEVIIDDRGATSVEGVFAGGDCTTVPYKQIVISMGAGATASLSAFDHLIRTSVSTEESVSV